MENYTLGAEITYLNKQWRVVRIVKSTSLHDEGVIDEDYIELRDINNSIEFIVLGSARSDYQGPHSNLPTLPTLGWRQLKEMKV